MGNDERIELGIRGFLARTPETKRQYAGVVEEWSYFLNGVSLGVGEATEIEVDIFIGEQRERKNPTTGKPIAQSTVWKKIVILKALYDYLLARKLVSENPFTHKKMTEPKGSIGQVRRPDSADFEEVLALLDAPSRFTDEGVRDRAYLALLFGSGMRPSEPLKLSVDDIGQTPAGVPFVRLRGTKNGDDVLQRIPEWAAKNVLALADRRRREGATNSEPLFITYRGNGSARTGKAMSYPTALRMFKEYRDAVGLKGRITPHSARHTVADFLRSMDIPTEKIQLMLRHKSVKTTEAYFNSRDEITRSPAEIVDYTKKSA